MWCDTFDADLLKVVPSATETLGDAASIQLRTQSYLTGGKINCPSCWNTHDGLAAFFWTTEQFRLDASYLTDAPEAECTFGEAVRDEWVHGCLIVVNRQLIWRPRHRWMEQLMYDIRGWTVLEDAEREVIRQAVRDSLRTAAGKMLELIPEGARLWARGPRTDGRLFFRLR